MYILGINYELHDSSVCLLKDNNIIFATEEERLSRVKHDGEFPLRAIKKALEFAKISVNDIDAIAFGWPRPPLPYLYPVYLFAKGYKLSYWNLAGFTRRFIQRNKNQGGAKLFLNEFENFRGKILYYPHHYSHAVSAYAVSGFDKATIIVMDGSGTDEATTIWYGEGENVKLIKKIRLPNSLGWFYMKFTQYLGFQPNSDEWKVMGLAPYGEKGINLQDFIRKNKSFYYIPGLKLLGNSFYDLSFFERKFGPKRAPDSEINKIHKDIAYAVQDETEKAILAIVKWAVNATGCRNLCLAGGVFLNCKANGVILREELVDRIFVQPVASDAGVAIGASIATKKELGAVMRVEPMRHVYYGEGFSEEEVKNILDAFKIRYRYIEDAAKVAAKMLSEKKIIGWFQGRAEFGPRALGNRSILADPRDADMKDRVNQIIKFRENWRPFAPSVLDEDCKDYFEHWHESPFMILSFSVKKDKAHLIPAVVHVDGSSRVQSVKKEVNQKYYQLIKEFKNITGVPVIMNTSFNLRGEPIVNSPKDALRTFYTSGLDALFMENFLIEK